MNIIDLITQQNSKLKHKIAFRIIEDNDAKTYTYSDISTLIDQYCSTLVQHTQKKDRVLIAYTTSIEYIITLLGCIKTGRIAVPCYPPHKKKHHQKNKRMAYIIENANIKLITATKNSEKYLQHYQIPCIDIAQQVHDSIDHIEANASEIAYLQYTSGTTSNPKGVMISHTNLHENIKAIQHNYKLTAKSHIASWLPLFHDMGLVGVIMQSLVTGATTTLLKTEQFIRSPVSWLKTISHYKCDVTVAPNFAYQACIDKIHESDLSDLNLSHLSVAIIGADTIYHQMIKQFSKKFKNCGLKSNIFQPSYGLAEGTLIVSSAPGKRHIKTSKAVYSNAESNHSFTAVSCGPVIENHKVMIVDPMTLSPCDDGKIGEIWFGGPCVANGYWNDHDSTQKVFNNKINSCDLSYLRTGDLGLISDQELYIISRLKDRMVIRGVNYFANEFEHSVCQHIDGIFSQRCVVFSYDDEQSEKLGIICEISRDHMKSDTNKICNDINLNISEYFNVQPSFIGLVKPLTLPTTSSGKIMRQTIKHNFLNNDIEYINTWHQKCDTTHKSADRADVSIEYDAIIDYLKSIIAKELKRDCSAISEQEHILSIGLDSLNIMNLSFAIQSNYHIKADVKLLTEATTIHDIADYILRAK